MSSWISFIQNLYLEYTNSMYPSFQINVPYNTKFFTILKSNQNKMFLGRGQKPEYLEKISWSRVNQQTQSTQDIDPGIKPRTHYWNARALTTVPTLYILCLKEINANNLLAWALCVVHRMNFLVGDLKNYYGPKVRAENLRTVLGSSSRTCNCQSWVACNLFCCRHCVFHCIVSAVDLPYWS